MTAKSPGQQLRTVHAADQYQPPTTLNHKCGRFFNSCHSPKSSVDIRTVYISGLHNIILVYIVGTTIAVI